MDLNTPSTREVSVTFGAFPGSADRQAVERALATATELAQLTWAGHDPGNFSMCFSSAIERRKRRPWTF